MMRRLFVGLAVTAVAFLTLVTSAGAHVNVDPSSAAQGSYAVLTFRVPNETDTDNTVGIRVQLPTDHPIASVSVQQKPGWTYTVKKTTLDKPITQHGNKITEVVSEVDWSGGTIKPGEFDTFAVSVGPLPTDTDQLIFKTLQDYVSPTGETSQVAWIEVAKSGGAEPEHPAPNLMLTSADSETTPSHDADTKTAPSGDAATPLVSAKDSATQKATSEDDSDNGALSSVALGVGVLGVLVGLGALVVALKNKEQTPEKES